jgi:hypothetical protein
MMKWCTSSAGDEVAVFSRWHKNGLYRCFLRENMSVWVRFNSIVDVYNQYCSVNYVNDKMKWNHAVRRAFIFSLNVALQSHQIFNIITVFSSYKIVIIIMDTLLQATKSYSLVTVCWRYYEISGIQLKNNTVSVRITFGRIL